MGWIKKFIGEVFCLKFSISGKGKVQKKNVKILSKKLSEFFENTISCQWACIIFFKNFLKKVLTKGVLCVMLWLRSEGKKYGFLPLHIFF